MIDVEYLAGKALELRRTVLAMCVRVGAGHLSTACSEAEIITALYQGGILKVDAQNPKSPDRDRFILSKGQGGIGLYCALADIGFFPKAELDNYLLKDGGLLGVHSEDNINGVEVLTGSLGHGLPLASGIAWALRQQDNDAMTVCLTGDGELCEGSNWEAMLTIAHQRLGHLVVIVDHNGGATIGHLEEHDGANDGPNLEPLMDKFEAFGFETLRIDGHNLNEVMTVFGQYINRQRPMIGRSVCMIADTVKGKGIKSFESGAIFPNHYLSLKGENLINALSDLGMDADEFKEAVGASCGY